MVEDQVLDKDKKFKFDMHNFDEEEYVDPYQEEEEPPPTFSEEDLEAAKAAAFAQGKQQGLDESKASRDQKIEQLLETISTQHTPFLEAENARERIYEIESVKLCYAVFKKLFPVYEEKHGEEELKRAISEILSKHQGKSKITIAVNPDATETIKEHIATISQDTIFDVTADESLDLMSCSLKWSDGGAVRHANKLAEEIFSSIEEALAAQGVSVHDTDNEESATEGENTEENIEQPTKEIPVESTEEAIEETPDAPVDIPEPEMEKKDDDG